MLFFCYYYSWCPGETGSKEMTRVLFPLMFDASTEYLAEFSVSNLTNLLLHLFNKYVLSENSKQDDKVYDIFSPFF